PRARQVDNLPHLLHPSRLREIDIMRRHLVSAILCGLALVPASRGQSGGYGSYLGKKYPDWVVGLSNKGDPAVRRSAAFALGKIGRGAAAAVPQLLHLLEKDPDAGVREMAAAAVGDIILESRQAEEGAGRPALGDPSRGRRLGLAPGHLQAL